jgi:hypothetical protein
VALFGDPLFEVDHATTSYSGAQPSQRFPQAQRFSKEEIGALGR